MASGLGQAGMELNTRGRYAVMAMAEIARSSADVPGAARAVSLSNIAERQHISLAYLEQIFLALRRAELVESVRGRGGGYKLTRPAEEITVADVMVAVEERTRMTRCMGAEDVGCIGRDKCLTHNLWHALGEKIRGFLSAVTLADVISGMPLHDLGVSDALAEPGTVSRERTAKRTQPGARA
jgi:Rrf2 family iron-sulfur cluster assembly transcriptional regulator